MKRKRGIKLERKAPTSPNKVRLFTADIYTVWWKGRAQPKQRGAMKPSRPRPKPWASLVVFIHDTTKRKRSYHIAWNGERFNDTREVELLYERELAIYEDLEYELPQFNERIIKARTRGRGSW